MVWMKFGSQKIQRGKHAKFAFSKKNVSQVSLSQNLCRTTLKKITPNYIKMKR
jgi:hypothetical protein